MLVYLHRAPEQISAETFFLSDGEALGLVSLREILLGALRLPRYSTDGSKVVDIAYESVYGLQHMHKFALQGVFNLSAEGAKLTLRRAQAVRLLHENKAEILSWLDGYADSCCIDSATNSEI